MVGTITVTHPTHPGGSGRKLEEKIMILETSWVKVERSMIHRVGADTASNDEGTEVDANNPLQLPGIRA